jgi:hypothetical protein
MPHVLIEYRVLVSTKMRFVKIFLMIAKLRRAGNTAGLYFGAQVRRISVSSSETNEPKFIRMGSYLFPPPGYAEISCCLWIIHAK